VRCRGRFRGKVDVVFLSPPWGGLGYERDGGLFDLRRDIPLPGGCSLRPVTGVAVAVVVVLLVVVVVVAVVDTPN
jgi:hypothetical protein